LRAQARSARSTARAVEVDDPSLRMIFVAMVSAARRQAG
jgi:hypothetical protein